jgi:hypothetical protein
MLLHGTLASLLVSPVRRITALFPAAVSAELRGDWGNSQPLLRNIGRRRAILKEFSK